MGCDTAESGDLRLPPTGRLFIDIAGVGAGGGDGNTFCSGGGGNGESRGLGVIELIGETIEGILGNALRGGMAGGRFDDRSKVDDVEGNASGLVLIVMFPSSGGGAGRALEKRDLPPGRGA